MGLKSPSCPHNENTKGGITAHRNVAGNAPEQLFHPGSEEEIPSDDVKPAKHEADERDGRGFEP